MLVLERLTPLERASFLRDAQSRQATVRAVLSSGRRGGVACNIEISRQRAKREVDAVIQGYRLVAVTAPGYRECLLGEE
jgi:hypothetical protein